MIKPGDRIIIKSGMAVGPRFGKITEIGLLETEHTKVFFARVELVDYTIRWFVSDIGRGIILCA